MTARRSCIAIATLMTAGLHAQRPDRVEGEVAATPRLELVREVPWSRSFERPFARDERELVMTFSGDGSWLAIAGTAFVEVATGTTVETNRRVSLVGPAAGDTFLLGSEWQLTIGDAFGNGRQLGLGLPSHLPVCGSPGGGHLVLDRPGGARHRSASTVLDLSTRTSHPLPTQTRSLTAIAWNGDETRLAVATAFRCKSGQWNADGVWLMDASARLLQRILFHREGTSTALAFAVDGRSLFYCDDRLRRAEVPSGRPLAEGDVHVSWIAPLDDEFLVALDDRAGGAQLLVIGGPRLIVHHHEALGDDRDRFTRTRCALSPARDRLAVSAPSGLRLYRVIPR